MNPRRYNPHGTEVQWYCTVVLSPGALRGFLGKRTAIGALPTRNQDCSCNLEPLQPNQSIPSIPSTETARAGTTHRIGIGIGIGTGTGAVRIFCEFVSGWG